jgi:hypothetical protein
MRSLKCLTALAIVFASVATIAPAAHAAGVKPTAINFGTVALNQFKSKAVTIELDPGYQLNSILGAGGPFAENPGNCTSVTTKCKANVFFTPTSVGVYDGTFTSRECTSTFSCNDFSVALHGVGGLLRMRPAVVNFGSVPLNKTKLKTVSIRLDPGFSLNSILGGGTPFAENLGNCTATTLKCKATVFFTPTSASTADGTLTARECDPTFNCDEVTIALHGVGM